jgi:hypothetical protein
VHDHSGEDMRLQEDQHAYETGEHKAVEEDEPQDVTFSTFLSCRHAGGCEGEPQVT